MAEAQNRSDLVKAIRMAREIVDEALPYYPPGEPVSADLREFRPIAFERVLRELLTYELEEDGTEGQ
jgi:hypothetical protein